MSRSDPWSCSFTPTQTCRVSRPLSSCLRLGEAQQCVPFLEAFSDVTLYRHGRCSLTRIRKVCIAVKFSKKGAVDWAGTDLLLRYCFDEFLRCIRFVVEYVVVGGLQNQTGEVLLLSVFDVFGPELLWMLGQCSLCIKPVTRVLDCGKVRSSVAGRSLILLSFNRRGTGGRLECRMGCASLRSSLGPEINR